jgi:hypothetical protein
VEELILTDGAKVAIVMPGSLHFPTQVSRLVYKKWRVHIVIDFLHALVIQATARDCDSLGLGGKNNLTQHLESTDQASHAITA